MILISTKAAGSLCVVHRRVGTGKTTQYPLIWERFFGDRVITREGMSFPHILPQGFTIRSLQVRSKWIEDYVCQTLNLSVENGWVDLPESIGINRLTDAVTKLWIRNGGICFCYGEYVIPSPSQYPESSETISLRHRLLQEMGPWLSQHSDWLKDGKINGVRVPPEYREAACRILRLGLFDQRSWG